ALEVEFKNGHVYRYFNVPFSTVEGLMHAGSAGKFFSRQIRDRFKCRQMS
ncbi:MAG: KTSC domain-containing protein, partial [Tepidisphaeraceae bacterium]